MFQGRAYQPTAPEKGSFPLDHKGQCKGPMKEFLSCLKTTDNQHHKCKEVSKNYLQCRMQRGLMQEEDLGELGYKYNVVLPDKDDDWIADRQKEGFVSGMPAKK